MNILSLLSTAGPLAGSILGLTYSIVVIGGLAFLIHSAGVYYFLPKWTIKGLGAWLTSR